MWLPSVYLGLERISFLKRGLGEVLYPVPGRVAVPVRRLSRLPSWLRTTLGSSETEHSDDRCKSGEPGRLARGAEVGLGPRSVNASPRSLGVAIRRRPATGRKKSRTPAERHGHQLCRDVLLRTTGARGVLCGVLASRALSLSSRLHGRTNHPCGAAPARVGRGTPAWSTHFGRWCGAGPRSTRRNGNGAVPSGHTNFSLVLSLLQVMAASRRPHRFIEPWSQVGLASPSTEITATDGARPVLDSPLGGTSCSSAERRTRAVQYGAGWRPTRRTSSGRVNLAAPDPSSPVLRTRSSRCTVDHVP